MGSLSVFGLTSFRYIKIQLDNEAERTPAKESINMLVQFPLVSVLSASLPSRILIFSKGPILSSHAGLVFHVCAKIEIFTVTP